MRAALCTQAGGYSLIVCSGEACPVRTPATRDYLKKNEVTQDPKIHPGSIEGGNSIALKTSAPLPRLSYDHPATSCLPTFSTRSRIRRFQVEVGYVPDERAPGSSSSVFSTSSGPQPCAVAPVSCSLPASWVARIAPRAQLLLAAAMSKRSRDSRDQFWDGRRSSRCDKRYPVPLPIYECIWALRMHRKNALTLHSFGR